MFEQILNIQMERYGENHIETGKIFLVFGLYNWWNSSLFKAKECLEKANSVMQYVLGDSHATTKEVRDLLEKMKTL